MTNEPKKIDPDRLALAADYAAGVRGVLPPGGVAGMRSLVAELISEREHQAALVRKLIVALERIAGGHEIDPIGYAGLCLDTVCPKGAPSE